MHTPPTKRTHVAFPPAEVKCGIFLSFNVTDFSHSKKQCWHRWSWQQTTRHPRSIFQPAHTCVCGKSVFRFSRKSTTNCSHKPSSLSSSDVEAYLLGSDGAIASNSKESCCTQPNAT